MGKLVVQQFVSADGFAGDVQRESTIFDRMVGDSSDFDRSNLAWLDTVGLIVLGATTYRMFVEYWPTPASANEIVAARINELPKVVFSHSLTSAPWGPHAPASIEYGDVNDVVPPFKTKTEGDIIVWGSLELTDALFSAGLVDTARIVVLPVTQGFGRGVFPSSIGMTPLRLDDTHVFENGIIQVQYGLPTN